MTEWLCESKSKLHVTGFPYFTYPYFPCAGYRDQPTYNFELSRLYDTMTHLQKILAQTEKAVLHITVGAAMEELYMDNNENIDLQWKQLYPYHLEKLAEDGHNIFHLIISPNKSFNVKHFVEPLFVSKTSDQEWEQCGDRHYVNKTGNYNVMIFCTMMPSDDLQNNNKVINKLVKDGYDMYGTLLQTKDDLEVVDAFYKQFDAMVAANGNGITTCFSFAVFRESTIHAMRGKDFKMFKRIKNSFTNENTQLLAEWIFVNKNYKVYTGTTFVSYVDPIFCKDDELTIDVKNGEIRVHPVKMDFNSCSKRKNTR